MNCIERFATSAAMIAAPFIFSGCKDDEKPLPMDQEIIGTATKVIYTCPFGTGLSKIQIEFASAEGQSFTLVFVASGEGDRDQAEAIATISTENFLTANTKVSKDLQNSFVDMTQNEEYTIAVDIFPGSEMTINGDLGRFKSFTIAVPSNAGSEIYYSFGNENKIKELASNREALTQKVEYILSSIKDDPFREGSDPMFLFAALSLK